LAVLALVIGGGTVFHAWLHHRVNGVYSPTQIALAFFLVINVLIAWWEIALFICYDDVRAGYAEAKGPYRGRAIEYVREVFARPIPILRYFSFRVWAPIWTGYSFFDDGYADKRSFGFNIDVGNGFSTLIPATIFAFGMTFHVLPARVLGIIGVIIFWQMFYGTVVYFFQYMNNRRYEGHSLRDVLLVVGLSNIAWLVMPLWGLKVSIDLIMDGTYAVFL
jgi:hypothetical protein